MTLWFVVGLLVPCCLIAAVLAAAWLSSAQADNDLHNE